jgi:Zn-dependent M28 family amino/carboxypeptidase
MFLFTLFFFLLNLQGAQYPDNTPVDTSEIKSTLSYIAHDLTRGRVTGSNGNMIVRTYLVQRLKEMGIQPFHSKSYTQSFRVAESTYLQDSVVGRNVVGVLPSLYYSDKYIVISAHYDHLGILGGRIYNGADDNASGVTSLLKIAEWFSHMRYNREGPRANIIFALFDAKESNMAGSRHFVDNLPVPSSSIKFNINIDQIGCTFSPPGESDNYILYVADKSLREAARRKLDFVNYLNSLDIDIDHTFYNSPSFYELFFRTSDQYNLSQAGIPSIMFTSGIHMHTYKPTDEHYFINYKVLINRTKLIFEFIKELM